MPAWTERQSLVSAVAFALRRVRPLLRRIAAEKHPPLDGEPDPAQMAAEKIVEQLELSCYELRARQAKLGAPRTKWRVRASLEGRCLRVPAFFVATRR